jgi:NAD-dependent SIR2 family protein deacetylase
MKQVILLGAGASVESGIKDASEMTRQFAELFAKESSLSKQSRVLNYVIGGLMLQKGAKGENPYDGLNIEDVFNAMDLLAGRTHFEAAPFIAGWHPVVEELDAVLIQPFVKKEVTVTSQQVNSSIGRSIDTEIATMIKAAGKTAFHRVGEQVRRMIEDSLRNLKIEVSQGGERPGGGKIFRSTCDEMIRKLIHLVWVEPSDIHRVQHLRPLVRHAFENESTIATLNYDNTIEVAASAEDRVVYTEMGETLSSEAEAEKAAEGQVHLLKLHGSINWCSYPDGTLGCLPGTRIGRAEKDEMLKPGYKPEVIFGQRNKLTAKGPFLRLLASFRSALDDADNLIIIGYSFRDSHVNEYITQWFNDAPSTRSITVVTPDKQWMQRSPFAGDLFRLQKKITVIPKKAGEAITELFG